MEEHGKNKKYHNKTQQLRACKQMEGLNLGLIRADLVLGLVLIGEIGAFFSC